MNTKNPEILTQRINKLMEERCLKKKEVAERLGIEYLTFWRKLKGKRGVDAVLLTKIANVLGTSVSYLMGESDNPNSNNKEGNTSIHLSNNPNNTDNQKRKLSFAYWGEVADTARDVAESGDKEAISYVSQMLNRALSSLTTKSDSRVSSHAVSEITNAPVMLGEHNENNFTFK